MKIKYNQLCQLQLTINHQWRNLQLNVIQMHVTIPYWMIYKLNTIKSNSNQLTDTINM